jgi:hypothetical protein
MKNAWERLWSRLSPTTKSSSQLTLEISTRSTRKAANRNGDSQEPALSFIRPLALTAR